MRGVRLKGEDDFVVGAGITRPDRRVFVLTPDGRGKLSDLEEYPIQGRGGGGVRTMKAAKNQSNQLAVAALVAPGWQALLQTSHQRIVMVDVDEAPLYKRDYRGDLFFMLEIGEYIRDLHVVAPPLQQSPALANGDEDDGLEIDEMAMASEMTDMEPLQSLDDPVEPSDNGKQPSNE
jgi:DNA gyrase subunit A